MRVGGPGPTRSLFCKDPRIDVQSCAPAAAHNHVRCAYTMLAACTLPTMNTIQQTAIKLLPGVRMVTSREEASRETFVTRLHKMIGSSPDDVVCWSEDGSSFAIRDLQAFQTVLRQKFRQSSMSSFVRQLNEYGFRKLRRKSRPTPSASSSSASASGFTASAIATGADKSHHYAHERFQRDTPELLGTIQRRHVGLRPRRHRGRASPL